MVYSMIFRFNSNQKIFLSVFGLIEAARVVHAMKCQGYKLDHASRDIGGNANDVTIALEYGASRCGGSDIKLPSERV